YGSGSHGGGGEPPSPPHDPAIDRRGWGGVTRRGAAQVRPRAGESASDAWRAAVSQSPRPAPAEKWEPERWEEVAHLRAEATRAVARGDRPARRAVPSRSDDADLGLETR